MEPIDSLKCDFCAGPYKCPDFSPEFLCLLHRFKCDQLLLICTSCKIKKNQNIAYCFQIAKEHEEIKQRLNGLTDLVLKLSVNQNVQLNKTISDSDMSIVSSPPSRQSSCNGNCSSYSPVTTIRKNEPVAALKDIIGEKLKIDPENWKQQKEIVTKFVNFVIDDFKLADILFKELYIRTHYTGSSYEGLRIVDACEYDIDLVFRLPLITQEFKFEYVPTLPSYVMLKFDQKLVGPKHEALGREVEKHFADDDRYISASKIRQWMQSIISKKKDVILQLAHKSCDKLVNVEHSTSGPAQTMKLITENDVISIDFVPVIEFVSPSWPNGADKSWIQEFKVSPEMCNMFLVPKPYNPKQRSYDVTVLNRLWRIHFPEIERKIVYNKGCVKSVIKLMKHLRDEEKWFALSSYFLKTVVIWAVKRHPEDEYWNESHINDRFMEVLNMLLEYLKEYSIPHLFYRDCNLLHKLSKNHCNNMYYRLKKLISTNLIEFKKNNGIQY